jgi:hypothetical protein
LAAQDVAAGDVVVEVPDDLVLMAENCSIADVLEGEGRGGGVSRARGGGEGWYVAESVVMTRHLS